MNEGPPPPGLQIRPEHWTLVRTILQDQVPECLVWAFGSRTQGRARPYSDLDLALESDRPLGLARLGALAEAFGESDLPWRVDLVEWCSASEAFRRIMARDRVLVQAGTSAGPVGASTSCCVGLQQEIEALP